MFEVWRVLVEGFKILFWPIFGEIVEDMSRFVEVEG